MMVVHRVRQLDQLRREGDMNHSLTDLADVVEALARECAGIFDLTYGGQALVEIDQHDQSYSGGIVQNPVKFCQEVAGIYLLGAGDYLYGTALSANPRHNLAFSSAALARSAYEFSAWSWWIQEASIDATERVQRTIGIVRSDIKHPGNAGQYGVPGERLIQELDSWANAQAFRVPRGTRKITEVIALMNPDNGPMHYKFLSGLTHGQLTPLLRIYDHVRRSQTDLECDQWERLLIASGAVLQAMEATCVLRGHVLPQTVVQLRELLDLFMSELTSFLDRQSGTWEGHG
ncbi:hypothetical protein [Actinomadura formosensis]|uniref:hypothetical protein n=1 Tax=Actinomadura formosensis TaxID=60706 RepID=UPI003D90DB5B